MWTQVYITGLPRSIDPSDEDIEAMLDERYGLSNDANVMWAGEGTTLIKRDAEGCCRGFAFLSFYSSDGAAAIIDRINANASSEHAGLGGDNNDGKNILQQLCLKAELSDPKLSKEKKKNKGNDESHLPDLRLRKQRKQPIRKHPVIVSSNGKKTNLGNKTR